MTRSIRFLLLLALLVVPGAPAHAATLELVATGQFEVRAKGEPEPGARVYRSLDPPLAFLVFTSAFPRPVFITTSPRGARLVDPARIARESRDAEAVRLDTGGVQEDFLAVRVEGQSLVADRDGIGVALAARPPVLGDRSAEDLARLLPEYRRNAARYTPDASALEKLRGVEQPAELIVFFGSWCPHCEQEVPRLMRVLQDAGSTRLSVRFRGLAQDGSRDPLADDLGIRTLPTGVLRRGDTELARLTGDDWDAPEKSIVAALAPR